MNILLIICLSGWIYFLSVFKRAKLEFFYFLTGSVGTFVWIMIFLQPIMTAPLQQGVAASAGLAGKLTGIYESYYQYSMLLIQNKGQSISLYIDYECSGIIEMAAFVSLTAFFPVYQSYEKIIHGLVGSIYIFAANVIRIFVIGLCIYLYGPKMYYTAHTIIGRIVFYSLSVVLYFRVFTKAQIKRQKVGNVSYESIE